MTRLRLTLACGDYDRTRGLYEGSITADGIDLTYLRLPVEETFFRMMRYREFDVAELSFSSYLLSLHQDPQPFVAIPVFPSRMFRHGCAYVNAQAGIETPADLRGKVVGCPEYQLSACVWIRGILADHYDVPVDSVRYRTGGEEQPGRIEKAAIDLPDGFEVEPIAADKTLSQMLASGEIDAMYCPRVPSPFAAGDPRVRRLFDDVVATEQSYYRSTGIFPIMHVIAIRREVYERDRWVAQSLYKAFCAAKDQAQESLYDASALRFMLPWLIQEYEQTRAALGEDFWPYGLQANRDTLATFTRYHHEQGLSLRRLSPEELFAPETSEAFLI